MTARMYNDDSYRIIPTAIHPGGSIGNQKQESGDDLNFIISGTGKAVRYAHNNSVIHRDINPSNILITEDNKVKLIDFGTAKIRGHIQQP